MSLQAYEIEELIYRHIKNELSNEEHRALEEWLALNDDNKKLFAELVNQQNWSPELQDIRFYASRKDDAKKKLTDMLLIAAPLAPVKKMWVKWVVAASVLGVVGISAVLLMTQGKKQEVATVTPAPVVNDVPPGGDKAILTLADGSTVVLDEAKNGVIGVQGDVEVLKKDGEVVYDVKGKNGEVAYNTLATPRGGQWVVKLPDGSKAWLNAASSIKYPVAFVGGERKVEITGEIYFEVEKNPKNPFKVYIKQDAGNGHKAEVQVLGTHFNINAYKDEPLVNTTLLEGKVRFVSGINNGTATLQPGEQAQLNNKGSIAVKKAVVDEVMAWKNGQFRFSGADLKTIMRQVSRWYDVDVRFESPVNPSYSFILKRNMPVSEIIDVLEQSGGAHFKIEGKVIKVLP